jgi:hypothetical protein
VKIPNEMTIQLKERRVYAGDKLIGRLVTLDLEAAPFMSDRPEMRIRLVLEPSTLEG